MEFAEKPMLKCLFNLFINNVSTENICCLDNYEVLTSQKDLDGHDEDDGDDDDIRLNANL